MIWSLPELSVGNSDLFDFAKRIGGTWIGAVKVAPSPYAIPAMCHRNVADHVIRHGGRAVHGFSILSYKRGLDLQAITHTVWEDTQGNRLDITPSTVPEMIVFVQSGANPICRFHNLYYKSLDKYGLIDDDTDMSYYVYLLVDPRTDKPFHVGKGQGRRAFDHPFRGREDNVHKNAKIAAILRDGFEPQVQYAAENILDEALAYDIEKTLIQQWCATVQDVTQETFKGVSL